MNKPKTILQAEKDALLRKIQSDIEPTGITLNQLNTWLSKRRRAEKDASPPVASAGPSNPRRRQTGLEISELDFMLSHLTIVADQLCLQCFQNLPVLK
jgi:hypothetical protein